MEPKDERTQPGDRPTIRRAYLDWRCGDLLKVPPVEVVAHGEAIPFRQLLAQYIDGRHVNDALYRAVLAIRREYSLEPGSYVVVFVTQRFELPIDLRVLVDAPGLVAIAYTPRRVGDLPVCLSSVDDELANRLRGRPRDEVIALLREVGAASPIDLPDRCGGECFRHRFSADGYERTFRYVSTGIPELDR